MDHAKIARTLAASRMPGMARVAWRQGLFRVRFALDREARPLLLCRTGGSLDQALTPRDVAVVIAVAGHATSDLPQPAAASQPAQPILKPQPGQPVATSQSSPPAVATQPSQQVPRPQPAQQVAKPRPSRAAQMPRRVWISGWSQGLDGLAARAAALEFASANPVSDLLDVGHGFSLHRIDVAEVRLEYGAALIDVDVDDYVSAVSEPVT
jgi:hypothetical protein